MPYLRILGAAAVQLRWSFVSITAVLALAFVMNYSGATATLGLAFAATGVAFPFFSAMLGWLGVFLTGSDTSSNALFGSLQEITAHRLGLSPTLMAASNSAGGVMGKMISLQSIAVAAAAAGMKAEEEPKLFRFTIRHSLTLAAAVGVLALLYTYLAALAAVSRSSRFLRSAAPLITAPFHSSQRLSILPSAMPGWLSVLLIGGETASNALFGSLQKITTHGLSLSPL